MTEIIIGIGKDEDGNITLNTDHEGEPREIMLGKLSPELVTVLYETAGILETLLEVNNSTIH